MDNIRIKFSLGGSIEQELQITDPSVTKESLIEMLQSGKVVTTIGHTTGEPSPVYKFDDNNQLIVIGRIVDQSAVSDVEFFDFELLNPEE